MPGHGGLRELPGQEFVVETDPVESNLAPGHEFSYQLAPSLTNDAWLHCRVVRRVNVDTPAGSFSDALEMLYLVDYGVLTYTNLIDPQVEYARTIDFGSVVYAPNFGPVYCCERNLVFVGTDTLTAGYGDRTLLLLDSNLLDN